MPSRTGDKFFLSWRLAFEWRLLRVTLMAHRIMKCLKRFLENLWNSSFKLLQSFKSCIRYYPIFPWYTVRLTESVVNYTAKVNYRKKIINSPSKHDSGLLTYFNLQCLLPYVNFMLYFFKISIF